jgi:RNA polymerase sigma factor (sigma-70 family)
MVEPRSTAPSVPGPASPGVGAELPAAHPAGLGDWFDHYHHRLIRFLARRLGGNAAEVEDLAQEAFLRLLRVERRELIRNPSAYLHQVAANVLLEWRLRARQQRPHSSDALGTLEAEGSVEDQAAAHLTRRLMQQALRELPPLCQSVLLLRSRDELSNEQIAERLGITRRMVKRHLEIGYAQLRDRLARLDP